MKRERTTHEISAGSMADIGFLLLIFFLVATVIDNDQGVLVQLPPYSIEPPTQLNEEKVLTIKINGLNNILIEGETINKGSVENSVLDFITEKFESQQQPIISLHTDRKTEYLYYLHLYNEIIAAFTSLRDTKSQQEYGKAYAALSKEHKKKIRGQVPMIISEAEPVDLIQNKPSS